MTPTAVPSWSPSRRRGQPRSASRGRVVGAARRRPRSRCMRRPSPGCSASGTTARCTRTAIWCRSSACSCSGRGARRWRGITPKPAVVPGPGRCSPLWLLLLVGGRFAGGHSRRAARAGRRRGGAGAAPARHGQRCATAWAAIAYLLLMVPLWDGFTEPLHSEVPEPVGQHRRADAATSSASRRIARARSSRCPTLTLEVARACSGVNYLVAVLALGLPLGYLYLRSPWRRVVLIVVGAVHRRALEQPARRAHRRARLSRRRRAAAWPGAHAARALRLGHRPRHAVRRPVDSDARRAPPQRGRRATARPLAPRDRPARDARASAAVAPSLRDARVVFWATAAWATWRSPRRSRSPARSIACRPRSAPGRADPYSDARPRSRGGPAPTRAAPHLPPGQIAPSTSTSPISRRNASPEKS